MLILERRLHDGLAIGSDVWLRVVEVRGSRVRLAIDAPKALPIRRDDSTAEVRLVPGLDQIEIDDDADTMLRSVLVIEDNEAHRRIIRDALDGSGVNEIASAHSIDAALRFLRDRIDRGGRLPSLILADLYMGSAAGASRITDGDGSPPPPPGLRLLRELQAPRLDRVPVVMLSACEDQALIDACIEAGARAFVQKTPEYDRFREAIYDTVKFWAATCDASDTPAADTDACPPDRCEPNTDGRRRAQHNNGKDNGKHNGQLDGHHEGHADGDASDLRRSASA